ncbi:hypothetical protein BO71DRAFT_486869 [Aspergillus ellipticus CBS 707.79]|uniref:F-box domain-containing protein n=1 Tax=Aspergillus ellipticus CBS 707.79 TaxID=1448320 RepID=A0A319CZR4_9EURO|nr:hypothetical protein BO71DRAFT_486869 [Aspergillus ellipticus CBS 707.79]
MKRARSPSSSRSNRTMRSRSQSSRPGSQSPAPKRRSYPGGSEPLPGDSDNRNRFPTPFHRFPAKLLIEMLGYLPDMATVNSVVHSCRAFYYAYKKNQVAAHRVMLEAFIKPELRRYAIINYEANYGIWRTDEEFDAFMAHVDAIMMPNFQWVGTLKGVREMMVTQNVIYDFARQFLIQHFPHEKIIDLQGRPTGDIRLSEGELHRVEVQLYLQSTVAQTFFSIHRTFDWANLSSKTKYIHRILTRLIHNWIEIEQFIVIWTFMDLNFSKCWDAPEFWPDLNREGPAADFGPPDGIASLLPPRGYMVCYIHDTVMQEFERFSPGHLVITHALKTWEYCKILVSLNIWQLRTTLMRSRELSSRPPCFKQDGSGLHEDPRVRMLPMTRPEPGLYNAVLLWDRARIRDIAYMNWSEVTNTRLYDEGQIRNILSALDRNGL